MSLLEGVHLAAPTEGEKITHSAQIRPAVEMELKSHHENSV